MTVDIYAFHPGGSADRNHFEWRDWPPFPNGIVLGPMPDPGNGIGVLDRGGHGTGVPRTLPARAYFQERDRGLLLDICGFSGRLFIASKAAKEKLLSLDPDAFDVVEARTIGVDGKGVEREGPPYWIVDVVRFIPALQPSDNTWWRADTEPYKILRGNPGKEKFSAAAIGRALVFRDYHRPSMMYCTKSLVEALKKGGLRIKTLRFDEAGELI